MTRSLVQSQFGANAAAYATSEVHAAGESLKMLVGMADPQPDWTGLDVATGAGHMALAFAPHVARMIASDITEEMLAETRSLAASRGITNVETVVASADRLPFGDGAFDLVCCRLAAHHFAEPAAFIADAARVLKPGGALALVDNVSPDEVTMPALSRAGARDAAILYNQFEKLRDPSHDRALTTGEWVEMIGDAELRIVAQRLIAKEMEFGAWVRRMRCTPDTVERLASMLEHDAAGGRGHLADFLMPRRAGNELWISLRELVVVARKSA